MAALGAEVLLPGHGAARSSARRACGAALADTAELLETLARQTLALMNEGAPLDEIVARRRACRAHLLDKPYLRPIYDEPEFVVRNVWRLYGGWWDGDPARAQAAAGDGAGARGGGAGRRRGGAGWRAPRSARRRGELRAGLPARRVGGAGRARRRRASSRRGARSTARAPRPRRR